MDRTNPPAVSIDSGGHYFAARGEPFFYLADTVWMLFNKLTEEEIRTLFADRATKGFTVIQAVVFRDLFEPNSENALGFRPFIDEVAMRAVRMNPEWLTWVQKVTKIADEFGLVMALLPTWGDKWNEHSNSAGPVVMNEASARDYCRTLSDALADCRNVIWVLGGDSPVLRQEQADIIRAMATGLRSGGSAGRLVTFHPSGMGSSFLFHSEPWLDFHSLQTSHYKPNIPGYLHIEQLFHASPAKPCMDMEPNYELSPMFVAARVENQPYTPAFSAYDVRKAFYRTVLAGAAGFTYGCEPIRQLLRTGDRVHIFAGAGLPTWQEAMHAPGSAQLSLLRAILEERSFFSRVPAQELLSPVLQQKPWPDWMSIGMEHGIGWNSDPVSRASAARCSEGSWIIVYLPVRRLMDIDTREVASDTLRVRIYDPESSALVHEFTTPNNGTLRFVPERDLDSLLVIDATGTDS